MGIYVSFLVHVLKYIFKLKLRILNTMVIVFGKGLGVIFELVDLKFVCGAEQWKVMIFLVEQYTISP